MGRSEHRSNDGRGPIVAIAQITCLGGRYILKYENVITPYFASKHKMTISAFSMGICLAKYLTHNILATMRDRRIVSKDTYRKLYLARTMTLGDSKRSTS